MPHRYRPRDMFWNICKSKIEVRTKTNANFSERRVFEFSMILLQIAGKWFEVGEPICIFVASLSFSVISFNIRLAIIDRLYKPVARKPWLTVYRAQSSI